MPLCFTLPIQLGIIHSLDEQYFILSRAAITRVQGDLLACTSCHHDPVSEVQRGSMPAVKQFEASVHGRVQGVSFRYYTRIEAERLSVTGWVANQPDGSVKVIAQGPGDVLERFIEFLHSGPRMARVDRLTVKWVVPNQFFTDFRVTWL